MTHVLRGFLRVFSCLLLLSVGACSREDREKREINKLIKNAIKEKQRPEMKKERIIEVFQKNKPFFFDLKDQMLQNPKAKQIGFGHPPGAHLINLKWIGKEEFSYEGVEKKFGIKEKWLRTMFEKMKEIDCMLLQKSYVYEDVGPSDYQPPRYESVEFVLEGGGFFGPDWTKGIAYYPHSYMPKTREDGYEGQWIFYNYLNKVEGDWFVFSRR
jgi:hypothetical protein